MKKLSGSTLTLLLGILIFLIGCIQPFRYETAKESGYEVDATIVEVKVRDETDSESGYSSTAYIVYADYEVDGKEYKHVRIGKYYNSDDYYVGNTVKTVVNPNNPGKPMFEGGVVCVIGFLIVICAVVSKIKARKKRKASQPTQ
jgi:uncharacterized membrane protein